MKSNIISIWLKIIYRDFFLECHMVQRRNNSSAGWFSSTLLINNTDLSLLIIWSFWINWFFSYILRQHLRIDLWFESIKKYILLKISPQKQITADKIRNNAMESIGSDQSSCFYASYNICSKKIISNGLLLYTIKGNLFFANLQTKH